MTMQKVIIDSCGWVALIEAGINIDIAMNELVGPYQLVLIPSVEQEINKLNAGGSNLLLELLQSKSVPQDVSGDSHTDDQILSLASDKGWPVLTVDRELKRRLIEASCNVIEVVANKRLRLASE
tara:strand:+ start:502 stop:873 length:372 start_codon:yes stop_codon:yes gene_type:complete